MTIIPSKLKEEFEDVARVYNTGNCIHTYPNALSRLQNEILKVCNQKISAENKFNKATELLREIYTNKSLIHIRNFKHINSDEIINLERTLEHWFIKVEELLKE